MYRLTVKGQKFTIPKKNLRMLAITKALDLKANVLLDTVDDAIKFLGSLGVKVESEDK